MDKKKDKGKMQEESDRNETSNEQVKESTPGDYDPGSNDEARKDLNEHTKRDNEIKKGEK